MTLTTNPGLFYLLNLVYVQILSVWIKDWTLP